MAGDRKQRSRFRHFVANRETSARRLSIRTNRRPNKKKQTMPAGRLIFQAIAEVGELRELIP
jgi:hypothetical protein